MKSLFIFLLAWIYLRNSLEMKHDICLLNKLKRHLVVYKQSALLTTSSDINSDIYIMLNDELYSRIKQSGF